MDVDAPPLHGRGNQPIPTDSMAITAAVLVGRMIVDSAGRDESPNAGGDAAVFLEWLLQRTDDGAVTTKKPYFELSKKARRRLAVVSVLRSVTVATLLVVIYYALPLDAPLGIDTFVDFGLGVLVFAGVIIWQVRAIGRSEVPRLRALQTVTSGVTLLLVLYAALYSAISYGQPDGFNQTLSRTDSLYFTVTVFATVGFCDIVPTSELARIVTMTQMLFGLLTFGLIARTLFSAVDVAVRRRESERPQPPTAESNDR